MNYKLILTLLLFPSICFAQYRGKVFEDLNGNGVMDSNERPLKGIAVTDGFNVVRTSETGEFELPGYEKSRFITVTTPSGYKAYNAYYQKIDKNKQTYDFGLIPFENRVRKDGSHSFVQITDSEITNLEGNENWASDVKDYALNQNAAFIIHTGDICRDKGMHNHIKLMNTKVCGTPVYYCIGNHDLIKGKYGEEVYESIYGPTWYSFEFGKVHYAVTPMFYGDAKPGYSMEEAFRWLKNDLNSLPAGTPVVIFNHDLRNYFDNDFTLDLGKGEKLSLSDYNFKAWVYGHWHANYMRRHNKFFSICTSTPDKGGIDHSPSSFRVLSIDSKGDIHSDLRYTYVHNKINIASANNGTCVKVQKNIFPLSVNVYNTKTLTSSVECKLYLNNRLVRKISLNQNTDWNWSKNVKVKKSMLGKPLEIEAIATMSDGSTLKTNEKIVLRQLDETSIQLDKNWTNLLGNASHTGGIVSGNLQSKSLDLKWLTNVGGNIFMASPLIYKGRVYTASLDENLKGEAKVCCLDAKNGKIEWEYSVPTSIKNSIAAYDGSILAQDTDGILYCLNADNGNLIWKLDMEQAEIPNLMEGLAIKDGVVYAGIGKGYCAVDIKSGKPLWFNKEWRQADGGPQTIAIGDKIAIHGANWGGLYGNDINTGKLVWQRKDRDMVFRASSAAIYGNKAYINAQKALVILDVMTGKTL